MLYDKATTEKDLPKYLLLFGDCVWDNRMITEDWKNASPDDYLLAYESDYSLGTLNNYTSDDYFGLLDDGEGEKSPQKNRPWHWPVYRQYTRRSKNHG